MSNINPGQPPRDLRIDLFRGLALVFIFWDHIPGNVMGLVTPRNLGLSDAAEIFVFLAGYSAALAYGGMLRQRGWLVAALRILRRAWTLYVAHIFVFALLTGIVFLTNAHVETRDYIQEMNLGYFVSDTERALVAELTLRFKPNLMDPLPLYILLLLAFAVALPLVIRRPLLTLAGSVLVYLGARHWQVNLQSQPDGVWFFNPFAWQLIFVAGATAATARLGPNGPWLAKFPAARRFLSGITGTYLLLCALLALLWQLPDLHAQLISESLGQILYPIDKTNLSPMRLLHFVALAWMTALVCRPGAWLSLMPARACQLMGRHSLEIFCLGVLLAPLADAISALNDDTWPVQVAVAIGGMLVMAGGAVFLQWSGTILNRKTLAPQPKAA